MAIVGVNTLRFYDSYAPELEDDEHLCARIRFTDSLEKIGWHKIHVETFKTCPPIV